MITSPVHIAKYFCLYTLRLLLLAGLYLANLALRYRNAKFKYLLKFVRCSISFNLPVINKKNITNYFKNAKINTCQIQ